MPWTEQIQTKIFNPLGMTNSFPTIADALNTLPQNEWPIGSTCVNGHPLYLDLSKDTVLDRFQPAGSIISTVDDMMKYVRFHMNVGAALNLSVNEWKPLATPNAVMVPSLTPVYPTVYGNMYSLGLETQKFRYAKFKFETLEFPF